MVGAVVAIDVPAEAGRSSSHARLASHAERADSVIRLGGTGGRAERAWQTR
jgi:hypothetical protein